MKTTINTLFCLTLFLATSAYGEVITDGTTGSLAAHTLLPNVVGGKSFEIPQSLGTSVGGNLFHSFNTFNINTGESATFTSVDSFQNVISRVTGNNPSTIDGLLRSTIANANFYFINPAGITFGANATIDVPAAFHVSTADKVLFADGHFDAKITPNSSVLTSAPPAAFGFVNPSPVAIQITGSQLAVKNGQSLDLSAGSITIKDNAKLIAPAGEIRLVAIKGNEAVSLVRDSDNNLPLPTLAPTLTNAGNITIQQSSLEAAGNGNERIALWGGDMVVNNGQIHIFNDAVTAANSAKLLDICSYSLNLDHADIATEAHSSGKGADVNVQTTRGINIRDSDIRTYTMQNANAGGISIDVGENLNINYFDGGINPDQNGIHSISIYDSTGNAGNVTAKVKGDIYAIHGRIESHSQGSGDASTVKVTSEGTITLNAGGNVATPSGNSNSASIGSVARGGTGSSGTTIVKAKEIGIFDGAWIASAAFPRANNAGDVTVTADKITIDGSHNLFWDTYIWSPVAPGTRGNAGTVTVNAGTLLLTHGYITADSFSVGNAGKVIINADNLKIDGMNVPRTHDQGAFSAISANSGSYQGVGGTGDAGSVAIKVGKLDVINWGAIDTSTDTAAGKAGSVTVDAKTINLSNNGLITSDSFGEHSSGKTGDVIITASDWIHLSDGGKIGITNEAKLPDADAADIIPGFVTVTAPEIVLTNSSISTTASGNVSAGNINLNFSRWFSTTRVPETDPTHGSLATQTTGYVGNSNFNVDFSKWLNHDPYFISTTANTGNGGAITINGSGLINLQNSGFLTSVLGANGNGGNINVTANSLIMNNGVIQANAVGGTGGDINLDLQTLIPSQNSLIKGGSLVNWQPFQSGLNVIQAASASGVNGSVNVTSPQFDISGSISGLNVNALAPPDLNRDPCRNLADNSLKRKGKGGLANDEQKDDFIPPAAVQNPLKAPELKSNSESEEITVDANAKNNTPCAAIK